MGTSKKRTLRCRSCAGRYPSHSSPLCYLSLMHRNPLNSFNLLCVSLHLTNITFLSIALSVCCKVQEIHPSGISFSIPGKLMMTSAEVAVDQKVKFSAVHVENRHSDFFLPWQIEANSSGRVERIRIRSLNCKAVGEGWVRMPTRRF